jgi:hypothetical protein
VHNELNSRYALHTKLNCENCGEPYGADTHRCKTHEHKFEAIVRTPEDVVLYEMCLECGEIRALNGALAPIRQFTR